MPGKDVTVRIVSNGLDGAIERAIHDAVVDVVTQTANAVADDWKSHAPVESGDYRGSIHVEDGDHDLQKIVTTALPGDDPYDIYNEYGTHEQSPNPVARQSANRHRKAYPNDAAKKIKEATD
jgi:hypothetical protein